MSKHHLHLTHFSLAIIIAFVAVSSLFIYFWLVVRLDTPITTLENTFGNTSKLLNSYASSTNIQFKLANKNGVTLGGNLRVEGATTLVDANLPNYAFRISGQSNYHAGKTRHTVSGTIEIRRVNRRYYVRLESFQLSKSLEKRWQQYLSIFRGNWYLLPPDTLTELTKAGGRSLTELLAKNGLINPETVGWAGPGEIRLTGGLNPKELSRLSHYFLQSRSILPPGLLAKVATKVKTTQPTGRFELSIDSEHQLAKKLSGEFIVDTEILDNADLTATFQTKFKNYNRSPEIIVPPDPTPPSEVVAEGVIEFDLRTLF